MNLLCVVCKNYEATPASEREREIPPVPQPKPNRGHFFSCLFSGLVYSSCPFALPPSPLSVCVCVCCLLFSFIYLLGQRQRLLGNCARRKAINFPTIKIVKVLSHTQRERDTGCNLVSLQCKYIKEIKLVRPGGR